MISTSSLNSGRSLLIFFCGSVEFKNGSGCIKSVLECHRGTNETEKWVDKDLMDISETLKVNMTFCMLQHPRKFGLRVCNYCIMFELYLLLSVLETSEYRSFYINKVISKTSGYWWYKMVLCAALQSQKADQIARVLKNKRNPNKFMVDLL